MNEKYKVIGIRYYNNEKGKGTMIAYLIPMSGDAKGYQEARAFINGKHLKDLEPNNLVQFVYGINYKGDPVIVDVKKVENK